MLTRHLQDEGARRVIGVHMISCIHPLLLLLLQQRRNIQANDSKQSKSSGWMRHTQRCHQHQGPTVRSSSKAAASKHHSRSKTAALSLSAPHGYKAGPPKTWAKKIITGQLCAERCNQCLSSKAVCPSTVQALMVSRLWSAKQQLQPLLQSPFGPPASAL